MARRIRVVDDGEAAFLSYVAHAPTVVLECRIGRHVFPGITDDKLSVVAKRGRVQLRADCAREVDGENCGTFLIKYLGADGIMEGAASKYDYEESKYPLPEAMEANGKLSKAQRGAIRLELVRRKEQAQRDAEKLAAKPKPRRNARPPAPAVKLSG